MQGGGTKDSTKPEARVVPNSALRQHQQHQQQGPSQSQSAVQWDRFEVALPKPSGRQKLGMVLKHAQVIYVMVFEYYFVCPISSSLRRGEEFSYTRYLVLGIYVSCDLLLVQQSIPLVPVRYIVYQYYCCTSGTAT